MRERRSKQRGRPERGASGAVRWRARAVLAAGALALAGAVPALSFAPAAPRATQGVPAAPSIVFSRQILPILQQECAGCHSGSAAPGGYRMEDAERLRAGGRHGPAVVPGRSAEGTLLRYLTGELKPQMPPGRPLDLETIALIRRWIEEGARIDRMTLPAEASGARETTPRGLPKRAASPGTAAPQRQTGGTGSGLLPARVLQSAPVTALVFSPDGARLAVGGFRAVRLLDPATGAVVETLSGPSDQVLALAWSSDGKRLAAGGGVPGEFGEVCVWEASAGRWSAPRRLREHRDTVPAVAWRPGTAELATASLDRTVKLWDAAAGTVRRTVTEHVDAVFGVAYSPDGRWLATGGADRTVKLYDAASGARVASYPHADPVTAVAFGARGDLLAVACDRQVWIWPARPGGAENPLRRHGEGEAVNALAFSADGSAFAWGAANRKVRLWNGDASQQRRELGDAADWVYAVALSPDGRRLAAGAGDGKVYLWSAAEGRLERAVALGPAAALSSAAAGVRP